MAKTEKRFSVRRDTPLLEQVLVQSIVAAGWKSSLMSRHRIETRQMSKSVSDNGVPVNGVFSAILTWDEHPDRIDVLAVVSESTSNSAVVIASCSELCESILAAIPYTCLL